MKYLLLLLLVGCEVQSDSYTKTELNRVQSEAKDYCSCRKGLDIFISTGSTITFRCIDGETVKLVGDFGSMKINGCGK